MSNFSVAPERTLFNNNNNYYYNNNKRKIHFHSIGHNRQILKRHMKQFGQPRSAITVN